MIKLDKLNKIRSECERMNLITLDEFNKIRSKQWSRCVNDSDEPMKNGIICPQCCEELYDTSPQCDLLSYPPQKRIHCERCDYKGLRYV